MHLPIFITYEVVMLCEWLGTESVDISVNLATSPDAVRIMLMVLSITGWVVISPFQMTQLGTWCFTWMMWIAALIGLFGLQYYTNSHPEHVIYAAIFFVASCLFFISCSVDCGLWSPVVFIVCAGLLLILWGVGAINENWPEYSAAAFLFTCWMWRVSIAAFSVLKYVSI